MKRLIGFALFCIAIGMLLMILISNEFLGCILVAIFLVAGYNLYCKC